MRHHSHDRPTVDCAAIYLAFHNYVLERLEIIFGATGGRLLAARRPRFKSTLHDIKAATSLREYDLFLRASFDRVRCDHHVHR